MNGAAADPWREPLAQFQVNGELLAKLLQLAGLCERKLALNIAAHASQFPAVTGRNFFLEYELFEKPVPAGFGLGFRPGVIDQYLGTEHWLFKTAAGKAIAKALTNDPFASDHATYLNVVSDSDPDWIEYDIAGEHVDPTPFIFFRFPSRFRTIRALEEAQGLYETLPTGAGHGDFARVLQALVDSGPAEMYRLGIAPQRGRDWWRVIITFLTHEQVTAALQTAGAGDFEISLECALDFYVAYGNHPGALFALSLDIRNLEITAMDVECPYLFRVKDPALRETGFKKFNQELVQSGLMAGHTADWLCDYCVKDVMVEEFPSRLRITLHHLKQRFLGNPHLRTKAYFLLELLSNPDSASS